MRRIIIGLIAIGMFVGFGTQYTMAGTWESNFDTGQAEGWDVLVGDWAVVGNTFEAFDETKAYARAITGQEDWSDYTVECDVTLIEGAINAAGIILRCDNECMNGYRFWIRSDTGNFEVYRWTDGNWAAPNFLSQNIGVVNGQTYGLKVKMEGSEFTCHVDGQEMGTFVDADQYRTNGKVALVAVNTRVQFDNVMITGDTIAAVNPSANNIATAWGKVKSF